MPTELSNLPTISSLPKTIRYFQKFIHSNKPKLFARLALSTPSLKPIVNVPSLWTMFADLGPLFPPPREFPRPPLLLPLRPLFGPFDSLLMLKIRESKSKLQILLTYEERSDSTVFCRPAAAMFGNTGLRVFGFPRPAITITKNSMRFSES